MTIAAHHQALFKHLQGEFERILPGFPLPELSGQHIFVTGGTGFVGYWLLHAFHWLNERGENIRLTLLSRNPAAFLERHPEFRMQPWLQWVQGDIKDYVWPTAPFDAFIHGAADTSPEASRSPRLFDDIALGTRHVTAHASAAGARRLLLVSSGAVYGEQPAMLPALPENFPGLDLPLGADDAYGRGKRAMEACALDAAGHQSIEVVLARCFSFVGFGLPGHLALSQFVDDASHREQLGITGDGLAVRSYLHAADLAVWLLALLGRGRSGEAYNVGSSIPLSLLETATLVRDTLAPGTPIKVLNHNADAPRQRYVPDTRRIEQELQVNCWTSPECAIRSMAKARQLAQSTGS